MYLCVCSLGSHGVHLEMSAQNTRALRFYKKLGFKVLESSDHVPADKVMVLGRLL